MAGIGNITKIEQDYMNAMIVLSRVYRKDRELVKLNNVRFSNDSEFVDTLYIKKNQIDSIEKVNSQQGQECYVIRTKISFYRPLMIDKKQGDELIKNW